MAMTEEEKEPIRQIIRQELMAILGTANQAKGFGAPSNDVDRAVARVFQLLEGSITSHNNYTLEREERRKQAE